MDAYARNRAGSAAVPGRVATSTMFATVSHAVVAELSVRYSGQIPDEEIERCVNAAAGELRGSVSEDSLPEMAIRLAIVRLYRRFGIVPAHHAVPASVRLSGQR